MADVGDPRSREPAGTSLIVPIPEAEPAVRALRAELDRYAAFAVPAHVTVLHPFLRSDRVGALQRRQVAEAVQSVSAFDVAFPRVEWFGEDVVYLAPEPQEPFRTLTRLLWTAFPESPPYGGLHIETTPHLTVAHGVGPGRLREAARKVTARLPIAARVEAVHLFQGRDEPGGWHSAERFPLGTPR
jgi:hypothetical protein